MTEGRLAVIRGRQGRAGLRGMSLSTFCDLVWTEIWDDCPAMGDQQQYRRIMRELFLDGKDPSEIYVVDAKGKKRPLGTAQEPGSIPTPTDAAAQLAKMREEALAAAAAREQPNE